MEDRLACIVSLSIRIGLVNGTEGTPIQLRIIAGGNLKQAGQFRRFEAVSGAFALVESVALDQVY